MPKLQTGYVYYDAAKGRYVARVTFTLDGKRKSLRRFFRTKSEAEAGLREMRPCQLPHPAPPASPAVPPPAQVTQAVQKPPQPEVQSLVQSAQTPGPVQSAPAERQACLPDRQAAVTFNGLADWYETVYLIPPVYVGDVKIAGLRSYAGLRRRLLVLRDYFGQKLLEQITCSELEKLRVHLLMKPARRGAQRTFADVNRLLSLLRAMLNAAVREGWLQTNPFSRGRPLIQPAYEKPRERVLSFEEEARLLARCEAWKANRRFRHRRVWRPILICALDTGMRAGEIFSLQWRDVNLEARLITIQALNTKTLRSRCVPVSQRLYEELKQLHS
ncbi:MAG TPA: tyrosine-type recombinase/integrase [Blastocatellia bacterium]|nr:tyrosine-type recombinase/integrase [Blastocatellia bacterium]